MDNYPSQHYVAELGSRNAWMKFWDSAMNFGVDTSLAILKTLCQTLFADGVDIVPADSPLCDHFLLHHFSTQSTTPVTSPRKLVG